MTDDSVSDEWHLLRLVIHRLDLRLWQAAGAKGKEPEPLPMPTEAKQRLDAKASMRLRSELARERHLRRLRERRRNST